MTTSRLTLEYDGTDFSGLGHRYEGKVRDNYTTKDGRKVSVDYSGVRHVSIDWNAHTVPNETNPYWGSIWVRNTRSQDDVPHILRLVPWFRRLAHDASSAARSTARRRSSSPA